MRDTRTDAGQYYPGGRVVAKRDVAPPEMIVAWTDIQGKPDFSDVPVLTPGDTTGKIKETVNTINAKMRGPNT